MFAQVSTSPLSFFPIERPAQSFLPTAFEEHISIRKECDNLQKNMSRRWLCLSQIYLYEKMIEIAKCESFFPFEVAVKFGRL